MKVKFLQSIIGWLKSTLGPNKGRPNVRILKEINGKLARVVQLSRETEGAVDCWKSIALYDSAYDVYVFVDRVKRSELGRDYVQLRAGSTSIRIRSNRESGLGGDPYPTHRVAVIAISKNPRLNNGKKHYETKVLGLLGLNLVRSFNSYDAGAKVLARRIATTMSNVFSDTWPWNEVILELKEEVLA